MDAPDGFSPVPARLAPPGFMPASPYAAKAAIIARHEKRDRSRVKELWAEKEKELRAELDARPKPRPKCAGTAKNGGPCGAIPKDGDSLCRWHKVDD